MAKIVTEPQALGDYTIRELVELAGTQGTELLNWLVARTALGGRVSKIHSNYHVPISNTASGMMVLENST
jgi:protocatechuate 4,5-dioxygenase beta chain